ncbi:hypothetical protein [Vreelandella massiliensis]|uniref:hypothetical protein n=1 Tax=Vreelandella massiliensis TaxID=1816686 RepID=UPI00096AB12B|nr:hypothetical protein [Halomonas massiliensis]
MTQQPEIVAYRHVNKKDPAMCGVSLTHDPSCYSTETNIEPLVRLSDYEALAAHVEQLIELAKAQQEWIDAVPQDVVLPTMPGFDRDWADRVLSDAPTTTFQKAIIQIEKLEREQNAIAQALNYHILLKQAEALEYAARNVVGWSSCQRLKDHAAELRQQAKGGAK